MWRAQRLLLTLRRVFGDDSPLWQHNPHRKSTPRLLLWASKRMTITNRISPPLKIMSKF